jgi:hypothetical protein
MAVDLDVEVRRTGRVRPSTGTVAPILFASLGVLTAIGCGKLKSDNDGGGDARLIDAPASERSDAPIDVATSEASDTSIDVVTSETDDASIDVATSEIADGLPADATFVDADQSVDAHAPEVEAGCVSSDVETFVGPTTIVTCPADATAIAGVVTPTCAFPYSLAPNNVFTGPVRLVSHLDRDFAAFDVNPIGDGRVQLMCDYANADGLGIGGIYEFIVASSCTATSAASFTCTR